MAASIGTQAKLGTDASSSTVTEPFEFVSENVRAVTSLVQSEGIRGTRSQVKERVRLGPYNVSGTIVLNPTPSELDKWLPRILGAAESTDTFALAETIPEFYLVIDRVAKVFTYAGCKVNKARFISSRSNLPMRLELDIIGKTETEGNAGTFPSLTIDSEGMYVHTDAVLTLQSSARECDNIVLEIDNMLNVRQMNSRTATDITAADRKITLACTVPYTSSEVALYSTPFGSAAGAAGSMVYTNPVTSDALTFTLANLKLLEAGAPTVGGRGEILLPLSYQAFMSSTTRELVVTSTNS